MRSIFLGAACLAIASVSYCAAASPGDAPALFQFLEKPGPHAVGLKVIEQYDYSRFYRGSVDELGKPYKGERARPIQTLVWYPAEKSAGKPMTVGDYGALRAAETNFDKPAMDASAKSWQEGMAPALASPLWAVKDAPLETGRFPVVIYAPSFSAAASENADLCEYLASHGYVVLATADMGVSTRDMTSDLPGIDAQARDISFLIDYAKTLPDTDMRELAAGGFSWGGISNLFAAARDSRIDALFALDGSMRYYPGLIKQSGYVHPERMTLPLLFFTQGEFTIEDQQRYLNEAANQGPNVLNAWTHGDLITVRMLGMVHTEFSSMYQRNEKVWKNFAEEQKADFGREDGAPGYQWVARYTLHFLDAYLKHDASALAYLKNTPQQNGAPAHFFSASFRAAKGSPPTLDGFKAQVGQQGFDHAAGIYAAMHKEDAEFKLDQEELNGWGYQLMAANHLPEAIALFKLNVQLYPESANVYDSLGEAYMKSGEKDLAIQNYKKSLQIEPDNPNGKEMLKALEADASKPK